MSTDRSRVVVGVDGSPASADALSWAVRYAEQSGAEIEAVTSWDAPIIDGAGRTEPSISPPSPSTAERLLVVGSRGHGGFTGQLLGSVSAHVVAHATCPVVVVRHQATPADEPAAEAAPITVLQGHTGW
jgi:nucleotide-binding universal stress UspA family protein